MKKQKMTKKEFNEKIDNLLSDPKLWEAIIQDEEYRLPNESECGEITFSEEFERKMREAFDFLSPI